MSRRTYVWNAFETTLSSGVDNSTATLPLVSVTDLRAPGYLVIDHDNPSKREYIKFAGINALTLTGCSRGQAGSAGGTGQSHDAGAPVKAVTVHQLFDELFSDVEDLEAEDVTLDAAITALEAADTAHFGAGGSAHSVASLVASGFMSAADKTKLDGIESGATGDLTAGEILAALLTVDGVGSGLDADKLQGYDPADFVPQVRIGQSDLGITSFGVGAYSQLENANNAYTVPTSWTTYEYALEITLRIVKESGGIAGDDADVKLQSPYGTDRCEMPGLLNNVSGVNSEYVTLLAGTNGTPITRAANPSIDWILFGQRTSVSTTFTARQRTYKLTAWRVT